MVVEPDASAAQAGRPVTPQFKVGWLEIALGVSALAWLGLHYLSSMFLAELAAIAVTFGLLIAEAVKLGQIWSRALWDIRNQLGPMKADTLILEGQFDFPGTTMSDLARATVAAAQNLYGKSVAKVVEAAFHDRGIL